jgi:hypothetical protein
MDVKHSRPTIAEPSTQIGSPHSQHSPRSAACKLSRKAASSVARGSPRGVRRGADRIFGEIGVDRDFAALGVADEFRPLFEQIGERFAD